MNLGERISPFSILNFRDVPLNVESLSDARTLLVGFFSILLEQKPCDHSHEDRSSYPDMLLKHVEGGRRWYRLSEL